MKTDVENTKMGSKKDKIIQKCVQMNTHFRNTRVRHVFFIYSVILCRFLLGTFLNIALLSRESGMLFQFIKTQFQVLLNLVISQHFSIFNLTIIIVLFSIQLTVIIFQLRNNQDGTKFGSHYGILCYTINPLLLRYLLKLVLANPKLSYLWIGIKTLSVTLIVFAFLNQILFVVISCNPQAKNQNLLVRQRRHKIFFKDLTTCLLASVTSLMIQLSNNNIEANMILIGLQLLMSLIPLYTLCTSFIFHNDTAELFYTIISCLQFTVCLIPLIASTAFETLITSNIQLMIATTTFFLFSGCKEFIGYCNHQCILTQIKSISSQAQLKQYIHILSLSLLNISGDNAQLDFILNSIKNQHIEMCNQTNCLCHKQSKNQQNKTELRKFLIKEQLKKIMGTDESDFQLIIFYCYFNLTYFMAFPDLLFQLNQIRKKQHFSFFQIIQYECFKKEIKHFLDKKKVMMNAAQTEKVQQQDEIILFFAKGIQKISSLKYLFWLSLGKKVPNFKVIDNSVRQQVHRMNMIDNMIQKILKEFLKSRTILQFVCLYQVYVKMKTKIPQGIRESLKNYSFTRNQQLKVMKNQKFKIDSVMYERYCVMFESKVEKDNMGIIMNVSKNITRVFGFTKQSIIGQNINQIMPKSMQKQHDVILQSWRERASWENIHKVRFIFAMTKDHVCFQSAIYLRMVQRLDSVNLIAAFVKANENDYMIINQDGIIDGVGMNFKLILGQKVAKLPLDLICTQTSRIFSEAKKENSGSINCLFYHVKDMEDQIQTYLYSKYEINGTTCQQAFSMDMAKNKQRSLMVTIEYKPYRMGRKFFVIIKLIEYHKFSSANNDNLNKKCDSEVFNKSLEQKIISNNQSSELQQDLQESRDSFIEKISEKQQNQKLNMFESNPSLHNSQHESNMSSEQIFNHLQQKFKQKHGLHSFIILCYCSIIIIMCVAAISLIVFGYLYSFQISLGVDDHTREAARFVERANSLNLIYSRFQNIDHNLGNPIYQVSRANVEIKRVEKTILQMHTDLYQPSYQLLQVRLGMITQWLSDDGSLQQINFSQFYTYFLNWCRKLQQKYIYGNQQVRMYRKNISAKNLQYIEKYIDISFDCLRDNVILFLAINANLSKLKVGIISFFLVLIAFLIWKSTLTEQRHHEGILKVLLTISDRNCQQCGMYFRQISNILSMCRIDYSNKGNEVESYQKQLLDNARLQEPLKQLQVQKDRYQKNKNLKYEGYNKIYIKKFVCIIPLILIPFLFYVMLAELEMNNKQVQFIQNLYQFMDIQIETVQYFITSKSQALHEEYQMIKNAEVKQIGINNQKFLNLFLAASKIYQINQNISLFTRNSNLCQIIKYQDVQLYQRKCRQNASFPFSRLKIYEFNTLIQSHIFNLPSQIQASLTNQTLNRVQILEQAINLKHIAICRLFNSFFIWFTQYRVDKMNYLFCLALILICTLAILLFMIWYLARRICRKMSEDCWRLIVIPQIVIRNTKGAMRLIGQVLKIFK